MGDGGGGGGGGGVWGGGGGGGGGVVGKSWLLFKYSSNARRLSRKRLQYRFINYKINIPSGYYVALLLFVFDKHVGYAKFVFYFAFYYYSSVPVAVSPRVVVVRKSI